MNIPLLFGISLAVLIIGIVLAILNIGFWVREDIKGNMNVGNLFLVHAFAAVFYALGGIGTVGFGIAWIVTYLKHV